MANEKLVWGPHKHGNGYRLYFRREGKTRATETVATLEEAEQLKRALVRELEAQESLTVAGALDKYERYLTGKGNKPMSVHGTLYRLKEFFVDRDGALTSLRPRECSALYQRLVSEPRKATNRPLAPDSHRNYLAESKSFLQWCVEAGFLSSNPLQQVKGQGRRRRGKAQLGIDEAKKFNEKALELAQLGDPGAVCVLVLLHKGPRATELINFRVRDLDDSGQLLWVREHAALSHLKTPASKRALSLPDFLQPFLIELAAGRRGEEHLFGKHWRDWPREQTQRICKLAGVPSVTAHGLRGLRATLSLLAGDDPDSVARSLGHKSTRMTLGTYAAPGTGAQLEDARVQKALVTKKSPRTTAAGDPAGPATSDPKTDRGI
jgi:integrase